MAVNMVGSRRAQGAQKRQRLVEGARRMIYHQGVERTTLADVATEANVAVGNIFYYFKTKDELVDAIVEGYSNERDELLARLDRRRTPRARLRALVDELDATRDSVSQHGCPIGTLASELDKRFGIEASSRSPELLGVVIDWVERQFREMGQPDARDLAVTLVAAYQGIAVLTHSLRDPDMMHRQMGRLLRWIDDVADPAAEASLLP
ncbi:TetR/AcrR family transcriptional regulator [Mycolicibacterium hodleri]|uniref:TetR/AcrR family transcriptional regulator n=1 Tax=Mycolicibacterium hodleri TaxID=49897 RepID=UPI0021F30611|nr:TetR/AcrR family transcriptional regulator [Mycolicibacterium hodleri]